MDVPSREVPDASGGTALSGPTTEKNAADPECSLVDTSFRRDRITSLGYTSLAAYAYCLYALAPFLALLRRDLGFSYLVMSLHSTAFAAGSLLSGLLFARALRLLGRHQLFWLSVLGTALGVALLATGTGIAVTLPAATLLGITGLMLQTSSLALLSAHHPRHRDRALVEANAGASLAAVLAPALIGSLGGTAQGWRIGMVLPLVAFAMLYLLGRGGSLPEHRPTAAGQGAGRMPGIFWLRCAALGSVAGIEFGMVFYGSQLLDSRLDIGISRAATLMTLFALGILIGRTAGSRLAIGTGRAPRLLLGSLLLTAVGYSAFWLSHSPALAGVALLTAGCGVANLFPLAFSHAIAAVPERSDVGAARNQFVVSAAIMAAPLALGALSDRVGVSSAFTVLAPLIVVALVLVSLGTRNEGRPNRA